VFELAAYLQEQRDCSDRAQMASLWCLTAAPPALPLHIRCYCLMRALFPNGFDVGKSVRSDALFAEELAVLRAVAALAGGDAVLGSLEMTVPVHAGSWPLVLKKLYDNDAVEEEDILGRYHGDCREKEAGNHARAKAAAQPFVRWLHQAASESDDSAPEEVSETNTERQRTGS